MAEAIRDWALEIVSDLYEAGLACDGHPFTAECYFIELTRPDGRRWRLNKAWFTAKQVEDYEHGEVYWADLREEKKLEALEIIDRIQHIGQVNLEHWSEVQPSYGSEFYARNWEECEAANRVHD